MSDRELGWFRLLVDCLSQGQPSARLLVRYLLDPAGLTWDERTLLEHRIETDVQVADQVEVLRGILFGIQGRAGGIHGELGRPLPPVTGA